jgi:hypothetical protein
MSVVITPEGFTNAVESLLHGTNQNIKAGTLKVT